MGADLTDFISSDQYKKDFAEAAEQQSLPILHDVKTHSDTIISFVESFESTTIFLDQVTAVHQYNTANIVLQIGKKLDLSTFKLVEAVLGARVHDVGKILVPKEIIQKPACLSDDEYGIIKTHCVMGHLMVSKFETPFCLEKYPLCHHERIDGSGYPSGDKGKEVSLMLRILHVADVFEATTATRHYRKPVTAINAIDYLYSELGQFDVKVIDALASFTRL